MKSNLSRREFIKIGGLALGSLAFTSFFPGQAEQDQGKLARVCSKQVDIRSQPNDKSPIVGNRFRDQLIHVYEELNPPDAPIFYNTLWYRVWGGYVHSAHLQMVQIRLNNVVSSLRPSGELCEITIPYTVAYQHTNWEGWKPWRGSRLYYSSTHWATGIDEGPDGRAWYRIVNELSESEIYFIPAEHLRVIPHSEYSPISTDLPPESKRIEVSLSEQKLRAFESGVEVFSARVSSGIPNTRLEEFELPTATPEGRFSIYSKMPSKHMGSVAGGPEVEERGSFTLPGVPWTSFFASPGGYALHGTYWHNNFGLQMSHGCVNMRNEDAKWIFRWSTPIYDPDKIESTRDWERTGLGTTVIIYT